MFREGVQIRLALARANNSAANFIGPRLILSFAMGRGGDGLLGFHRSSGRLVVYAEKPTGRRAGYGHGPACRQRYEDNVRGDSRTQRHLDPAHLGDANGTDWRDNRTTLQPLVETFQGARANSEQFGAARLRCERTNIVLHVRMGSTISEDSNGAARISEAGCPWRVQPWPDRSQYRRRVWLAHWPCAPDRKPVARPPCPQRPVLHAALPGFSRP